MLIDRDADEDDSETYERDWSNGGKRDSYCSQCAPSPKPRSPSSMTTVGPLRKTKFSDYTSLELTIWKYSGASGSAVLPSLVHSRVKQRSDETDTGRVNKRMGMLMS